MIVREPAVRRTVLLIDADPTGRRLTRLALAAAGFESRIPMIIVTARGRSSDVVRTPLPRIRVADLEITPKQAQVLGGDRAVTVTRTELALLCRLASAPGRTYTRDELLREVWGYQHYCDRRLVDVQVRRLRRKIETDPSAARLLVTVRGHGYRLAT